YDLGCGDGRVLIAAVEKYQANAVGVEIDPKVATRARSWITKAGVEAHARVIQGDLLIVDLTGADVLVIYLGRQLNEVLRPPTVSLLPRGRYSRRDIPIRARLVKSEVRLRSQERSCAYRCVTASLSRSVPRSRARWRSTPGPAHRSRSGPRAANLSKCSSV